MEAENDQDPEVAAAAARATGVTSAKDIVRAETEAGRRAERRARLVNSAGGPDLGDVAVMSGAWA